MVLSSFFLWRELQMELEGNIVEKFYLNAYFQKYLHLCTLRNFVIHHENPSDIADETLELSRNFLKTSFYFAFLNWRFQLMNKLKGHFYPTPFFIKIYFFIKHLSWYFIGINYRSIKPDQNVATFLWFEAHIVKMYPRKFFSYVLLKKILSVWFRREWVSWRE